MITLTPKSNTRNTTAVSVTINSHTRYYHIGNSERVNTNVIKLAAKKSKEELTEAASEFQLFLHTIGRSYKSEATGLSTRLFGLGLYRFESEIKALKCAKSRRQLDSIIEDVMYTICAAYVVKELDSKYIEISEPKELTIPELIKLISSGSTPILTPKQAKSINEIATRKQARGDTSANWELVIKHAWC